MKSTDGKIQAALSRVMSRMLLLRAKHPQVSDEELVQRALGEEWLAHGTDPKQVVRVKR